MNDVVTANETNQFPRTLVWIGLFVTVSTAFFALERAWEETFLTWENGPQLVGFALQHSPLALVPYMAVFAGLLWLMATVVCVYQRRSFGGAAVVSFIVIYLLAVGLQSVPDGVWRRAFVEKLAKSPHANEFMFHAAADGDLVTVEKLLSNGVTVNARNADGATALHGAARWGQLQVMDLLVSKGAEINAISSFGVSPLQEAISNHQDAAIAFLTKHGGTAIRGTVEERKKAIQDRLRRADEANDRSRRVN